ncbi:MAG TPA: hypothetical protein EYP98_20570 [Planctomycetes bacterium]|nr:hypothetical protein [Planctomycetota bacterium]
MHCVAYALVAMVTGCAWMGGIAPPPTVLQFIDYKGFDDQLHDSLREDYPAVNVAFAPDSVMLNQLPERLDRWLSRIHKDNDGRVEARPDPAFPNERSVVLAAIPLLFLAYDFTKSWALYRPAGDYNAIVYYVPGTGVLTRVLFVRR